MNTLPAIAIILIGLPSVFGATLEAGAESVRGRCGGGQESCCGLAGSPAQSLRGTLRLFASTNNPPPSSMARVP